MKFKNNHIHRYNIIILGLSIAISCGYFFFHLLRHNYDMVALIVLILLLPLVMSIVEKRYKLNEIVKFGLYMFLFLSIVLGSVVNLYDYLPGYDKAVHFISGILITALLLDIFNHLNKNIKDYNLIVLVTGFNILIAILWEINEYLADTFLGTLSQKGTRDTILDMTFGTLGGIIFIISYYLRKKDKR